MFKSLREFLALLRKHWVGLVISGVGGILTVLPPLVRNFHTTKDVGGVVTHPPVEISIAPGVWVPIVVIGLLVAAFLAFHDVRVGRDSRSISDGEALSAAMSPALDAIKVTDKPVRVEGSQVDRQGMTTTVTFQTADYGVPVEPMADDEVMPSSSPPPSSPSRRTVKKSVAKKAPAKSPRTKKA